MGQVKIYLGQVSGKWEKILMLDTGNTEHHNIFYNAWLMVLTIQ